MIHTGAPAHYTLTVMVTFPIIQRNVYDVTIGTVVLPANCTPTVTQYDFCRRLRFQIFIIHFSNSRYISSSGMSASFKNQLC